MTASDVFAALAGAFLVGFGVKTFYPDAPAWLLIVTGAVVAALVAARRSPT